MTQRKRFAEPPSPDDPQGGMTGATGSLTPDGSDDEFIPAETRELNDPAASHAGTASAHQRAEERHRAQPDEPGSLIELGEETAPNDRDGGYGSSHGLAPDDPAYRQEVDPALNEAGYGPPATPAERGTRIGGDEVHEEEHF
jgi:hypothetical protein